MMGLPESPQPESIDNHAAKVRRFSRLVFCNVLLLFGLRVSGINLDELANTPEIFNGKEDVCLRLSWERVTGAAEPVRLCSEWIKLADPSGQPHHLTKDIAVRRGADGQYYVDPGVRSDFRLLALAVFVGVVLLFGMWVRKYLVSRYRLQLDPAPSRSASDLR
jgi:hypothetical protein